MTDTRTVLVVVVVLGLIAMTGLGFIGLMAYQEKAIPDALIGITSSAAGAFATLLASTRTQPEPKA